MRGSTLPEHRRVLGAQGRDLHDPGRRLHAQLRLLRRGPWHSGSSRCRRTTAAGRCRSADGTEARRHHERGSRRFGERRRRGVRRLHHGHPAAAAADIGRSPDSRLQGQRRGAPSRRRCAARHSQSQPRNDRPALPHCAARGPLHARAGAARPCQRNESRAADEVRDHLRAGRRLGRAAHGAARPARSARRHRHDRPVPAAVRPASAHRALVHAGRVRRAEALGNVAGIRSRRIGSAGSLQLSRVGASGGSHRMTATARSAKATTAPSPPPELHLKMLRQMLLVRRFEEKAAEAYALGKVGGFCHLYIGQEAVAVAAIAALRDDDYVICSYREHGQALLKGISPNAVMAELFGKATGCSKGKGGSMHLFDATRGFMGGHGIVGGHIPLGAGLAFASKYLGNDKVCVCFFGEAAVNIGAFHETLNMAAVWKLPAIFLCENNRYGMGTAFERVAAVTDIVEHACSYDMAAELVDGMNVLTMYDATRRAVERARNQSHPTLLEVRTYRYMGHSMSDPLHGVYRTKDEVEEQKARDPIAQLAGKLKEDGVIDQAPLDALHAEIHAEDEEAVKCAHASPDPEPGELFTDVLVD